ncbi:glycosyltransferase [Salinibacter altiplanensis]|uniref:glycosyltransferase n=1 Tax=Salinibacter altiplanensis TaxID=1803181 RepID=UPI000C9FE07F|nr:glycosyltransferase [Salinibacter altiplanensis]
MRVVLTISSLDQEAGGTSYAVAAMARHLAARDCDVAVVSFESEQPLLEASSGDRDVPSVTLVERTASPWHTWGNLSRFGETLRNVAGKRDETIIHDNGLWLPVNHWVARVARSLNCPRIVSPHGMLEPWSLDQGAWKKKAAWWLYQKRDLQTAETLVATAEQEAKNIRGLGVDRAIATVPNGVDRPDDLPDDDESADERTVLFLSRIHEKKGLLNLVDAWDRLRPDGWRVVIAGPDEDGHEAEVRRRIAERNLGEAFSFVGPVEGDEKWSLYQKSDLFVLPTHSENFGIVVAEALSCGTPVITTKGAPWRDLEEYECGWWVEIGAEPLAAALNEAIHLSGAERAAMGRWGKELVDQKYTWPQVAKKLEETYASVLRKPARPAIGSVEKRVE